MRTLRRSSTVLALGLLVLILAIPSRAGAQVMLEPPHVFGYFQNSLTYVNAKHADQDYTSFSVQQLNLMLQQELTSDWTAFFNLEFVNSFSTGKLFGELNLEEAWVRYRINPRLNLKLGLQVPEFNRLNSIKTKMPLLPYIIRPLAYESSLSEVIPTEEYVPGQAYVSLYGTIPVGRVKIEHAVYVGNSPNLSTVLGSGQSAVDTSKTFLTGFRIGIRSDAVQAGFSASLDFVDYPGDLLNYFRDKNADISEIPRYRIGADLRLVGGPLTFEGELISVRYDDDIEETLIDKEFYYGTLLCAVNEHLTVFAGYWYTTQDVIEPPQGLDVGLDNFVATQRIPNVGAAYTINDRLTAKLHFGKVDEDTGTRYRNNDQYDFMHYGLAFSAMF